MTWLRKKSRTPDFKPLYVNSFMNFSGRIHFKEFYNLQLIHIFLNYILSNAVYLSTISYCTMLGKIGHEIKCGYFGPKLPNTPIKLSSLNSESVSPFSHFEELRHLKLLVSFNLTLNCCTLKSELLSCTRSFVFQRCKTQ